MSQEGENGRPGTPDPDPSSSIIGTGRKSAFQPYKPITILTNLQRGNVKTSNREVTTQPLTFHERAARGELVPDEVNPSNVNLVDETGKTALMWAAYHARLPTVMMLVEKGADVNLVGKRLESPLIYAAASGQLAVINYLLQQGADADAADLDGNTPLIFATYGNHAQSVTALLQHGASITHFNYNGDSPFSIAVSKRLLAAQHAMENFIREFIETNCAKVANFVKLEQQEGFEPVMEAA